MKALHREANGGMPGTLLLESWYRISGPKVTEDSVVVFSAETPTNWNDNFGDLISVYVIAPTRGNDTFHVAGDAYCQLWLSPFTSKFANQEKTLNPAFQ
jgi:hypothetical protein